MGGGARREKIMAQAGRIEIPTTHLTSQILTHTVAQTKLRPEIKLHSREKKKSLKKLHNVTFKLHTENRVRSNAEKGTKHKITCSKHTGRDAERSINHPKIKYNLTGQGHLSRCSHQLLGSPANIKLILTSLLTTLISFA